MSTSEIVKPIDEVAEALGIRTRKELADGGGYAALADLDENQLSALSSLYISEGADLQKFRGEADDVFAEGPSSESVNTDVDAGRGSTGTVVREVADMPQVEAEGAITLESYCKGLATYLSSVYDKYEEEMGIEAGTCRRLCPDKLFAFADLVKSTNSPLALFMRHGQQESMAGISKEGPYKKIDLMSDPANMIDGTDKVSRLEGFVLGQAFRMLNAFWQRKIGFVTSPNGRAEEMVASMAAATGASYDQDDRLKCLTYRSGLAQEMKELKDAQATPEAILDATGVHHEKGTMKFIKAHTDAACGEGSYEGKRQGVEALIAEILSGENDGLTIAGIHTQAAQLASGNFDDRPDTLGFVLVYKNAQGEPVPVYFKEGLFVS